MNVIQAIHHCDVSMFNWCMARKRIDLCTRVSRWISRSGDGYLYLFIGLCAYAMPISSGQTFLACALSAFLVERCLYFALKNGFRRGRPQEALPNFRSFIIPSDRFSFPSGHTSAAFLMATLIAYFFPGLVWAAFVWAALVGLSRIFLGVHFPTDVLVGMSLGVGVALMSLRMLNL